MIPAPKPEPLKKAPKPAPVESNGYPVAVLLREEGRYKAGLRVTTDPARPSDPKGREPIRVDPGRFAAWAKSGAFERIEKPEKKPVDPPADSPTTPPVDPPLVPMAETPPVEVAHGSIDDMMPDPEPVLAAETPPPAAQGEEV